MKCHPLRWVWGLPFVALLSWLAGSAIQDSVERDLTTRTEQALKAANLDWAKVKFDGRDGLLSGESDDDEEGGKAIHIASVVDGVRVVDGQPDLLRTVEPYTWQAVVHQGKVKLSGFVPSEKARKAAMAAAKSMFPKDTPLEDTMELARGNPPVAQWLEGVRFELKQLALLRHGKVDLSGLHSSYEGEALTTAAFKQVRTALNSGLPKVLSLKSEHITPPVITPYEWSAKLADGQLVLGGYVPSEQAQVEVLTHAKRLFGKAVILDRLELADGAPAHFDKAVRVALEQLATLQEGSAALAGDVLALQGSASDEVGAATTRKAFRTGAPDTFKVTEQIKGLRRVVSPFTTTIDAALGAIELNGYVPSEASRANVVNGFKARFATRAIHDHLQVAAGEPPGYEACMQAALAGLARLGEGRIELTDRTVELSGHTTDESLVRDLPETVRSSVNGACETKVRISYDDSAKRTAAEQAKREAELAESARRDTEQAEHARREAALAAARLADESSKATAQTEESKKAAAQAEQDKKTATDCEENLRHAARSGVITFETASDVLSRQSRPTLKALLEIAERCANVMIEIEGHTDSEGHPERQQPLSERRAQAVVDYLVDHGVDVSRIKAVGYGDTRPVAPNDTPENRAKNRRIDFTVKSK